MSHHSDKNNIGKDQEDSEGSKRDGAHLWRLLQKYKYLYMASVVGCVFVAILYLWYVPIQYEVFTKVLVKDVKPSENLYTSHDALSARMLPHEGHDFYNEMEVLATKTLNKKIVRILKLYVSYEMIGFFKNEEIYGKSAPYRFDIQEDMLDSLAFPIEVTLAQEEDGLNVVVQAETYKEEQTLSSIPANVTTPYGVIVISKNTKGVMSYLDDGMKVIIRPIEAVAKEYASALSVRAASPMTTVAEISLKDCLPERSSDYLNKLVEIYNDEVKVENTIEATRTRDFIDERLADISKDLNMTEAELKQYKRGGGMAHYKSDGTIDATQNVLHEQKLVEVGTQIDLINYLIEYCNDKHNEMQIVPANIGLNNEQINAVVTKYNETILERNRLLDAADAAAVEAITKDVESQFATLRSILQSTKNQAVVQRNELLNQQGNATRNNASSSRGRALADINRLQEVKSGLYLMLLQKREENLLLFSSVSSKARQIEEPTVREETFPNKTMTLMCALVLGLLLPCIVIYIREVKTF